MNISAFSFFPPTPLFLSSPPAFAGEAIGGIVYVYAAAAVISLLLLIGYCSMVKQQQPWFLLLFSSVFVVNSGYFTLSVSSVVEEALLANRISYLGSVFLPLAMLMIITDVCRLRIPRWTVGLLVSFSSITFLVAASPGYCGIYYQSVFLVRDGGVAFLEKEYGPLHGLYLYYLLFYLFCMIGTILFASWKKKLESRMHAVILAGAVCVNIAVWLLEQLVRLDFEFLSISYIITELFLLGLALMFQENRSAALSSPPSAKTPDEPAEPDAPPASVLVPSSGNASVQKSLRVIHYKTQLAGLTPTERAIHLAYLEGRRGKEVMEQMGITENTLKYHNKNIYSKLGVSSRKELLALHEILLQEENIAK